MSLRRISATEAVARLPEFSAVIDVRSPSEFAEDRLPGAVNWPVLDDDERRVIGTEYASAPFEARKRGAVLVARRIAAHIEREVLAQPHGWRPLVYCWRGGMRSNAFATVVGEIGFPVHVLEGGYQAFRRTVIAELETLPSKLRIAVFCGSTGSAKSRLLAALTAAGAQVLDLERLAHHRGSLLGALPDMPQPTQKAFETAIWQALRSFDPARAVFAEAESRTIGRLRVPEALLERVRGATCVEVKLPMDQRVKLLLEDYAHFVNDTESFCERLGALGELRGKATVERWQAAARAGGHGEVVRELLEQHYDPNYARSIPRHFARFESARRVDLHDAGPATLADMARRIVAAAEAAMREPPAA